MHYIYQHIRLDKNEVFYIGKGIHKSKNYKFYRAFDKKRRNNIWKSITTKTDYEVEILYQNLTEQKCFEIEISLISKYGKIYNKTGSLANYTDGGEGQLRFYKNTKEQKESATKAREIAWKLPRTELQIKTLSKNALIANPCKRILQYDLNNTFIKEFVSISDAERETKIRHSNISECCNNKRKRAGKFIWKFKT